MIRYLFFATFLLALLFGCAIGEPTRNIEFARQDLELERKKYQTFAGSKEREAIDQEINYHNNKWYVDLYSQDQLHPTVPQDDAERIKKINDLLDKQLHGTQPPIQK